MLPGTPSTSYITPPPTDLDVEQAQRVQPDLAVGGYLVVEAVGPPSISEEYNGHGLIQNVWAGRCGLGVDWGVSTGRCGQRDVDRKVWAGIQQYNPIVPPRSGTAEARKHRQHS